MRVTRLVEAGWRLEHEVLDRLASVLPVGQPVSASYPGMAEQLQVGAHTMLKAKQSFEAAGIVRITLTYPKGQSGRVSTWEMLLPVDRAHEELTREHQRQAQRPSRKSAQRAQRGGARSKVLTKTMPLPEAPHLNPAEAQTLIREAREYLKRLERAQEHVAEWTQLGIRATGVTLEADPRLAAIAEVLPAIEELELERDRLRDQNERWRAELAGGEEPRP